jgi:hypothetical protein
LFVTETVALTLLNAHAFDDGQKFEKVAQSESGIDMVPPRSMFSKASPREESMAGGDPHFDVTASETLPRSAVLPATPAHVM